MHLKLYFFILFIFAAAMLFANINIEGKLTHEFAAGAGDSLSGSIIIRNNGDKAEEVKIYQKDYSSVAGGIHNYLDAGTNPRSNTGWITISPKKFFIQAGEAYIAYFSISIPSDETLAGTYWSILMVEAIPEQSPESSNYNPDNTGLGVQTVLRYGIRMITHINDSGTVSPEVISANLMHEEDKLFLVLDIKNAGSRLLRINTWAELHNSLGEFSGKFEGDHLAIFPASSIRFKVDLTGIPPETYKALLVLDCGGDNVFGINYDLVIE
jgi:hypothetical protein